MRRHKRFHGKPTRTTKAIGYYTRTIQRVIWIVAWTFVLFLLIAGIIYVVPKVLQAIL